MRFSGASRSRWVSPFLSLVTVLCLVGLVWAMAWGSSALLVPGAGGAGPSGSTGGAGADQVGTLGAALDRDAAVPPADPGHSLAAASGTAAASAEPALAPPDVEGPYRVGWYNTEFEVEPYGVYRASIYYPARSDARFAAPDASGAPYPGIVASNGYYGSDWNITWVPRQMASHGYVAICFTPPAGGTLNTWNWSGLVQSWDTTQWAEGFKGGIGKLREQSGLSGSLIQGLLDVDTIGGIGLSMGGGGVLEAAGTGAEFDAVVGLAPAYSDVDDELGFCELLAQTGSPMADDIPDWVCWLADAVDAAGRLDRVFGDVRAAAGNVTVPAQLQVGSADAFIPPAWVRSAYGDIPGTSGKAYVEIDGASHAGFIDAWVLPFGDAIEGALGGGIEIDVQEQHRVSQKYFVSWFNYFLKGQTDYGTFIFGDEAQADVAGGVLSGLETSMP